MKEPINFSMDKEHIYIYFPDCYRAIDNGKKHELIIALPYSDAQRVVNVIEAMLPDNNKLTDKQPKQEEG
jgi:hypothetical protein